MITFKNKYLKSLITLTNDLREWHIFHSRRDIDRDTPAVTKHTKNCSELWAQLWCIPHSLELFSDVICTHSKSWFRTINIIGTKSLQVKPKVSRNPEMRFTSLSQITRKRDGRMYQLTQSEKLRTISGPETSETFGKHTRMACWTRKAPRSKDASSYITVFFSPTSSCSLVDLLILACPSIKRSTTFWRFVSASIFSISAPHKGQSLKRERHALFTKKMYYLQMSRRIFILPLFLLLKWGSGICETRKIIEELLIYTYLQNTCEQGTHLLLS